MVYRGKDPFIGRTVAIKTITGNFTDNPDLLERFYREARAAGGLQHPNIVTIYDMGEDSGTPYIAMELLEGDDLGHIVEKEREEGGNPLPASIKLSYIVQVCRALEYAHKRNIVHRDIKPGNIVVTNEGTVKVVDFGIARLTDTSSTSSGMLIGTIDYMSPEQIRGEKVDGRSDIWAVGVMTYEVLSYTKPFQGGNITAVMFAIVSQEPKSIRDLRPDLPPELDDVMRRIFKKEPAERYQNMEELLGELEPIARKMQQESVGVLVSQGENLLKQGELQRAKELLKQALVLDTSHMHAKTLLDKVNTAIKQSEIAPKLNAMVAEAEKAFQSGNLDDARRQADAALHMDSSFTPARELLGKLQEAEMQLKMVQTGLREARQKLAEGSLTEADQSLERVLKTSPQNEEAVLLHKQILEEKERRTRRKQLADGVQKARQMWTAQQFEDALKVLGGLEKEFPGETEVAKLLDAVKADKAQDEIQRALAEARKQLGAQSFNEALGTLDKLLQRYPNESAAVKLRELVLQERSEHAKQLRLQKELESLKRQVNEEKFADAISNGEALLKEYPDDFELGRLIEFAKAQRAQQDVLKRRQSRNQEINNLVQDNNFEAAIKACQDALKDFPSDAEFKQRLEQINTQQKEFKNRERQRLLDERLREMKQSIERGDLTGAIDIGSRTMVQTGKDTDLTKLMEIAKQERSIRDLRRKHDEQALKAMDLLESKKFDEAAKILRVLERDDILDPRIASLMRAAEDKRVPTKEDLTLMRSKPVQGADGDEGDKTRVGMGGMGRPSPAPVAAPSGDTGATRVFRPGGADLDETVKSKTPLVAPPPAPPAQAPATMNAAAVAPPPPAPSPVVPPPVQPVVKPVAPQVDEKTTVVPPKVEEITAVTPPKTKEDKKKQKEREKEEERAKKVEVKASTAPAAVIAPPKPEVKPPAPAPPPPAAPKPVAQPAASAATAAPPVKEPPAKPAVEERKEPPKPPSYEPVSEPKKGGSMGMIIGGVVAVVVLAVGGYFVFGGKKGPDTSGSGPNPTTTATPTTGGPTTGGGTGTVTPPPPPVVTGPPAAVVKQFESLMAEANKALTNQKYDDARKAADKAKTFASQNNLPVEFTRRSDALPDKIATAEKNAANKAFQANLKDSNDTFTKIKSEISNGDFGAAESDIQKLDSIGEGNAHKDDVAGLRADVDAGKKLDTAFAQAQSMAQSNDVNTLRNAKQTLSQIASGGGRHAKEAAGLVENVQKSIDRVITGEFKSKLESAQSAVTQAISAKDKSGAQAKLNELQGIGSDPNFPSSLRGELNSMISGDNTKIAGIVTTPAVTTPSTPSFVVSCSVMQQTHKEYTSAFKAGQQMAQMFLDKDLELKGGQNCGFPGEGLQKGEWRLLIGVDTSGNVTDSSLLMGDAGFGAKIASVAKANWHFTPPTLKNQPVQTKVAVIVRVN